jgi:hypothetical protein
MPIIVNELVFKGTITEAPKDGKTQPKPERQPAIDRQVLVELCVEEVLKILERRKER